MASAATLLSLLRPAAASTPGRSEPGPRIGLALGSGGVRGLAHLSVFEVLEELGVRPCCIAGSSIGAIMGALYAAGLSTAQIRAAIEALALRTDEGWARALFKGNWTRWLQFFRPFGDDGGLVEADAFIEHLADLAGVRRFEALEIPLQVVATDYWQRSPAVFDAGELWPAVQGSMAVPGLFSPVSHQERVLVDGGLTNPVPYDILPDDCDITIAVDVLGARVPEDGDTGVAPKPSYLDNSFNTFQIMQSAILQEKLRRQQPDFLVSPEIRNVQMLDFHRFEEIFAQAQPAAERLREGLQARLGGR